MQAFRVQCHAPAAPALMHDPSTGPSPWMPLLFSPGPEAQGEPGHSRKERPPGWGRPVRGSCPRPQLAEATAQAGRLALPWAQTGAPTAWLVFCWNRQRGGKREVRRDSQGPRDAHLPPQRQNPNTSLTELSPGQLGGHHSASTGPNTPTTKHACFWTKKSCQESPVKVQVP